jgi:hypothetical protein
MKIILSLLTIFLNLNLFATELVALRYYKNGSNVLKIVNANGKTIYEENGDDQLQYQLIQDKAVLHDRFSNLIVIDSEGKELLKRQNIKSYNLVDKAIGLLTNSNTAEVVKLSDLKTVISINNADRVRVSNTMAVIREPWRKTLKLISLNTNEVMDTDGVNLDWSYDEMKLSDNFFYMKDSWGYVSVLNQKGEALIKINNQIRNIDLSDEFLVVTDVWGLTQIYDSKSNEPIYSSFDITIKNLTNEYVIFEWAGAILIRNIQGDTDSYSVNYIQDYKILNNIFAMRSNTNALSIFYKGELKTTLNNVYADYQVLENSVMVRTNPNEIRLLNLEKNKSIDVSTFDMDMFLVSDEMVAVKQKTANTLIVKNLDNKEIVSQIMVNDFRLPIYPAQFKWLKF